MFDFMVGEFQVSREKELKEAVIIDADEIELMKTKKASS